MIPDGSVKSVTSTSVKLYGLVGPRNEVDTLLIRGSVKSVCHNSAQTHCWPIIYDALSHLLETKLCWEVPF